MTDAGKYVVAGLLAGAFLVWLVNAQNEDKKRRARTDSKPAVATGVERKPQRAPEPPPEPMYTDEIIDRETTKSGTIKRVKWHIGEDGEPCSAKENFLDVEEEGGGMLSWSVSENPTTVSTNEYSLMKAVRTLGPPKRMTIVWCDGLDRTSRYMIIDQPSHRMWRTTVYDRKWH